MRGLDFKALLAQIPPHQRMRQLEQQQQKTMVNDIPYGGAPSTFPARTVTVPAATTTLTLTAAAHAFALILVQSTAGLAITPPAATGTFNIYSFLCITTISGGSFTVDPKAGNASDVVGGSAFCGSSGGTSATFGTASNSNFITFNATTTGGLIGTYMWMIDVKTNGWVCFISDVCSGTAATPFSNH